MNIIEAIERSNLGKYQKIIDKCNRKKGCDKFCSKSEQEICIKLINHKKEIENLKYERWYSFERKGPNKAIKKNSKQEEQNNRRQTT